MPAPRPGSHESYMLEALRLARRYGRVPYPNPWVGCVVVKDGKIVGRGAHRGAGFPHAEVGALRQAGRRARGSEMYVTLEPCCHYGRTPPCTDAIIRGGISEVVYALPDPNPLVAGRGARILRARGITVRSGLYRREAAALNEAYLKYRSTGLPFVTLKVATSLDGKIQTRTGQSKWITDAFARRQARRLRAEHQAVLVGINTVLADDPGLGPGRRGGPQFWRLVLDSRLRIPLASRVVRSRGCIVACSTRASARKKTQLRRRGVTVWTFPAQRIPLKALLKKLAESGIVSVLVEGGSEVLGSFFDAALVDRVYWFFAPLVIGSTRSLPAVAGRGAASLANAWRLRDVRLERLRECWVAVGNLSRWALASGELFNEPPARRRG